MFFCRYFAVNLKHKTMEKEQLTISDFRNYAFDFFDIEALVNQVVSVLAAPENYAHLGRQARETVLEKCDLQSRCLPQLLELLGVGAQPLEVINP